MGLLSNIFINFVTLTANQKDLTALYQNSSSYGL